MIRDGKSDALYDDSSPRLQATIIEQRFVERAQQLNQTLGQFKRILATNDHGVTHEARGDTGYVEASLEFDRAKTTGTFGFDWDAKDRRWRLYGFYIDIPKALRGQVPAPELVKPKREAPSDVVALVKAMLEDIRYDRAGQVWDRAHPEFQQVISRERFIDLVAKRKREMGNFVKVIDLTKTGRNEREKDKKKSWVTAVLEFEHATTTGTFDFRTEEGDPTGTWKLSKFKIDIPEPAVPERPASRPGG